MPHLSLLGMEAAVLQQWQKTLPHQSQDYDSSKQRKKTTKNEEQSTLDMISWRNAWDEYVRGNVVSNAAAKLVTRFLLNTMAATATAADGPQSDADASGSEDEIPPMKLSAIKFQELIKSSKDDDSLGEKCIASTKNKLRASDSGPVKKKARLNEYEHSHRIGERVWKTDSSAVEAGERGTPGNMYEQTYQDHLDALKQQGKEAHHQNAPFDEKRDAAACYDPAGYSTASIDTVLASIMNGSKRPNKKQRELLEHFVGRLKVEWLEKKQGNVNQSTGEPLLDVVHGFPGTGKSAVIGWMRQLMEEGLGWEHSVQFVCLAFQNAMAAQINGHTVHHWSGIPARNDDGNACGDKHKQSMKCGALRVIIIDEVQLGKEKCNMHAHFSTKSSGHPRRTNKY